MARFVLVFAGIHDALAAEKEVLKPPRGQSSFEGRGTADSPGLLPLPPSIKSDCGFGLFLDTIDGEERRALASLRATVRFEAAYSVHEVESSDPRKKETIYERIDQAH
jgi:hypothetical protein